MVHLFIILATEANNGLFPAGIGSGRGGSRPTLFHTAIIQCHNLAGRVMCLRLATRRCSCGCKG
ncbi:MAG: hypothetical protein WBM66_13555, partial [Thiothrix litoralis]